ncbi:uncharacterized protein PHACADRAFT_262238 [Phanerochaete carnosa HHB-10118-sp]|uniref:Yeast cell wall synthesis Kre9/Knh1-like N-terminal domain-containing protein n=1 Tax=Phanerochaete carnosa (strain HHB-10118-sp) TaxID=650164 RepID=K5UPX8_PHACS|nr:uncharacterized protein PHACADRAFT_262238 [Phanerochaete carnosa HHB-10118-sp]EKM51856.1 hypothetical protein PHACADRAFT_262238 [Phanerochaete carnosa HHB-10118-sp]
MFSKTTLFATFLATVASVAAHPLDVWDPKIITPNSYTVWAPGGTYNVTWDTSDAPASISEGSEVVLAKSGVLDSANPLAQGFDLRAGWVPVTIPASTIPGSDYSIVLFGDSGNASPEFAIEYLKPVQL